MFFPPHKTQQGNEIYLDGTVKLRDGIIFNPDTFLGEYVFRSICERAELVWKTDELSYDEQILTKFARYKHRSALPYDPKSGKFLNVVDGKPVKVYVHFDTMVREFECSSMGNMCKYITKKIDLATFLKESSEDIFRLFNICLPLKGLPREEIKCITDCFNVSWFMPPKLGYIENFVCQSLYNEKIFLMILRAIGMKILTVVTFKYCKCPNANICCSQCYGTDDKSQYYDLYDPLKDFNAREGSYCDKMEKYRDEVFELEFTSDKPDLLLAEGRLGF